MAESLLIKSGHCYMLPKLFATKDSSRQSQHLQAKSCRCLFNGRQTNSNLSMMLTLSETEKKRTRLPSIFATYQSFQVSFPMPTIVSPTEKHQVFINFRGDQLRHNFVSHLVNAFKNHGINFFIDKKEQLGKDLKNLFVRIEESRIALVIFSTRYSESKWCLNELVKMKKRADEGKLEIIPIFYKVEPRDVRRPTNKSEFGRNFLMLTEAFDWRTDPTYEWREALECIANKMGLCLGEKSSEADFVEEIVKEVERVNKASGLEEV